MQAPKKGGKNCAKLLYHYGQTLFLTREETAFGILIVWTLYTTCETIGRSYALLDLICVW